MAYLGWQVASAVLAEVNWGCNETDRRHDVKFLSWGMRFSTLPLVYGTGKSQLLQTVGIVSLTGVMKSLVYMFGGAGASLQTSLKVCMPQHGVARG